MPELPDLQVFSKNLNKKLAGKTVKSVNVVISKKLNVSADELKQALHSKKLHKVYREGKELYLQFEGHTLAIHLMLHGELNLFENTNENKFTVLELHFDDNTGLALSDFQKSATPTLNPADKEAPDALSEVVTEDWFIQSLAKKKGAIKAVLLDQDFIRGIGNAYADEILYDAGISPFSSANKIPEEKVRALAKSVHKVLTEAEKQITKLSPDIIKGEVRDFLQVHQKERLETPKGEPILIKEGSRKTYYTEAQELFK